MGYPEIILDKTGEKIDGCMFTSDIILEHWAELDEFEGEAYTRVLSCVELKDKTKVEAYIYTLKQ